MSAEARQMLEESKIGTIADQTYVGALIRKWKPLLQGMPERTEQDRFILGVTAMLCENQSRDLKRMNEEVRTVNVGAFTKFIFPVLRRVFPNLIANEIVSVQPMTAPIGAVFFLDYIYGTNKGQTQAGNIFPRDFDKHYSSEFVNGEPLAVGDGAAFGGAGTALTAILNFNPIRPKDTTRGFQLIVREINASTGATVQEALDDGGGAFTGAVASGSVNYSNGSITNFKFTNAAAATNPIRAYYYYDGELSSKVPQMQLDIKKASVEAGSRRLKALWSSEASEDLRAFHGLDAETEIVGVVARDIALEIDREILDDIYLASGGTTGTFDRIPPAGISELDHLRAILTPLSTMSSTIHTKTLRAPANWIVTSPAIGALLAQLTTHGDYRPIYVSGGETPYGPVDMPRPITQHGQFGITKIGTLQNKWLVYEDPFFTRDRLLMGLKGDSYLEAGYVWAPYVPLQVTPTFLDPNDFSFRKGLRTRYAKKLLRSEYYAQMTVQNL